jgi:hypothetical protein
MDNSYLYDYIGNPQKMIIIFFIFLFLTHLPFILSKNLTKRGWKKVDYIWLFSSFLGIFFMIAESRIKFSKDVSKLARNRSIHAFEDIKNLVNPRDHKYYCIKRDNKDDTTSNIIKKIYVDESLCTWMFQAHEYLSQLEVNQIPEIKLENLNSIVCTDLFCGDVMKTVKDYIVIYQKFREEYIKSNNFTEHTNIENILSFYAPYLLFFALAIRIAKVTGELKLED